jgi:hypothetical protein
MVLAGQVVLAEMGREDPAAAADRPLRQVEQVVMAVQVVSIPVVAMVAPRQGLPMLQSVAPGLAAMEERAVPRQAATAAQ